MNFFSGFYQKAEKQGEAYTALDVVKLLAIISMTIDHIGVYMMPENYWLRAIGRIAAVVFLFLVGYSRSTEISKQLMVYAGITVAAQPFLGFPIFPFNILVSIIIARLALNYFVKHNWLPARAHEIVILCVVFSFLTMPFIEYGSIAILCAVFGRMVREHQQHHLHLVAFSCFGLFTFWQYFTGLYTVPQITYVVVTLGGIIAWLVKCPNKVIWENWHESMWKTGITVLSRNTLPYYFYHRILFQIIGMLILGKTFGFTWVWMDFD